ncbi:MAG: diaminopimelate epimerase [Alphaproteobacteria bacterium]|nr:diaminopimelate epimerase [Alphaproteobacteria bacterium]
MIPFLKMNGLGNDFVVIDHRTTDANTASTVAIESDLAQRIADRRRGVGFDQLVLIEDARQPGAVAFLRFLNADGSESGACGNGARCASAQLMRETGARDIIVETQSGLSSAILCDDGTVSVDQGVAELDWRNVPLASEMDTLHLDLSLGAVSDPVAVGMGNPHCVFFVEDADAIDVEALGAQIEISPLFPERTNVEFVSIHNRTRMRMRVWERGVGVTQACGTGACAAAVAAHRRGLCDRETEVVLDGGSLFTTYRPDGHVILRGPVEWNFQGEFDDEGAAS